MDSILNKIHELLLEKGVEELERKAFIQQLQKELKDKKYGLVWENKVEKVSEKLKTHIPYLTEVEEKRLLGSPEDEIHHLLIEGDNLEALTLLQTTHKGGINICYIDPPYNRGKNDFVYNDHYIDKEDVYRHSKWLSFMEKRLRLAYDLLSNDGVIFISIDDNEMYQLKLLCDQIFSPENFVCNFIWKKRSSLQYTEPLVCSQTEYILAYCKNKTYWNYKENKIFNRVRKPFDAMGYSNPDNDPKGPWLSSGKQRDDGRPSYTVVSPTGVKHHGPWIPSPEEFQRWQDEGLIWWGVDGSAIPRKKSYLKDFIGNVSSTLLMDEFVYLKNEDSDSLKKKKVWEVGTTEKGTKELKDIIGKNDFDYPKPSSLIKYLVSLFPNKDITVLDFFAGSGTTGQAVLELNKEDNGKRRCILCTNNEVSKDKQEKYFSLKDKEFEEYSKTESYKERIKEPEFQSLGICQSITYKRIQNIVNGYFSSNKNRIKGIPSNWHYYKINTIPKVNNSTDNAVEYLTKGIEIIAIKENVFDKKDFSNYSILSNKDKVILVYLQPFVLGHEVIEISKELEGYPQSKKIIYSTMTDVLIEGIEIKEYPEEILEQINRIQEILKQWEGESDE